MTNIRNKHSNADLQIAVLLCLLLVLFFFMCAFISYHSVDKSSSNAFIVHSSFNPGNIWNLYFQTAAQFGEGPWWGCSGMWSNCSHSWYLQPKGCNAWSSFTGKYIHSAFWFCYSGSHGNQNNVPKMHLLVIFTVEHLFSCCSSHFEPGN